MTAGWAQFLAGLALLNAAITIHAWLPQADAAAALRPAPEAMLIALAGIALVARPSRRGRVTAVVSWSVVIGLLVTFGSAEAFYRYYYERSFEPYTDIRFVRGGLLLLLGPTPDAILIPITVALGILILTVGCLVARGSLSLMVGGYAASVRARIPVSATLAMAGLFLGIWFPSEPLSVVLADGLSPPSPLGADGVVESSVEVETAARGSGVATVARKSRGNGDPPGFPGLGGADLHLFFIESYGRTAFERRAIRAHLDDVFASVEQTLRHAGYAVSSTYLSSPVLGGYSWIAEAAFLTGTPIDNQARYEAAIERQVRTLSGILRESGYVTLLSMPGTVHGPWPEARTFYRFEHVMLAPDFDYSGPMFSFVPITDQIALHQAHRRLEAVREDTPGRPAYAQHVLVSSHAPYNRIPPYVPEWDNLGDGAIYTEEAVATFENDWFRGSEFIEGYVAALTYSLTTVAEYIAEVVNRDVVAILVGDHQPGPQVRGRNATSSVPIHVVARDQRLIERFLSRGYSLGFVPNTEPPHVPSHRFLDTFLEIATESLPQTE